MASHTMRNYARYPRQKYRLPSPRTKTGCFECRRYRKKCDEHRPICSRCISRRIDCHWPDSGPAEEPASQVSSTSDRVQKHISIQSAPPSPPSLARPCPVSWGSWDGWSSLGIMKADLTSHSPAFMDQYVRETSNLLVTVSTKENPFITHLLPVAANDELILHSILTLGGAHLDSKHTSAPTRLCVRKHYGRFIHLLREAINHFSPDPAKSLIIALSLLMLCMIEAFGSIPEAGAISHIRACQKVVPLLLHTPSDSTAHGALLGVALEFYTFISLIISATPYANSTDMEPDTRSPSFIPSRHILERFRTFGVITARIFPLIELIPRVISLCQRRQADSASNECLRANWTEFHEIIRCIGSFENQPQMLPSNLCHLEPQDVQVGKLYVHALTIFTYDAMWGNALADSSALVAVVHQHAIAALDLLPCLLPTRMASILLWPIAIIGSCLISDQDRDRFRKALQGEVQCIPLVQKLQDILYTLWEKGTTPYYGPSGLQKILLTERLTLYLS
ncbi:fungal-specific transcription factor domain-containing protein [Aspergillus sergii]|uniref:Fungal-specific transcription factor domain-containing protein n=1 Tax=Aspergillus sergii TaxID=1034303 RepID=A0A5N6WYM7_9EURO|nr:fungal-specific transcription factor domain-containing protein [Aspergillus sergii]